MGSGKGYLSSFLSLQYGLNVFGIDSSSTNTHGALERNRKLKKFSRAYQKSKSRAGRAQRDSTTESPREESLCGGDDASHEEALIGSSDVQPAEEITLEDDNNDNSRAEELFLSAFSADVAQTPSPRIPPAQLSAEEKERRKRENLERKAQRRGDSGGGTALFSPLTSYVTPETELRELIDELRVRKCIASCSMRFSIDRPAPTYLTSPTNSGGGGRRAAHLRRPGAQHAEDVRGQAGAGGRLQRGLLLSPAVRGVRRRQGRYGIWTHSHTPTIFGGGLKCVLLTQPPSLFPALLAPPTAHKAAPDTRRAHIIGLICSTVSPCVHILWQRRRMLGQELEELPSWRINNCRLGPIKLFSWIWDENKTFPSLLIPHTVINYGPCCQDYA